MLDPDVEDRVKLRQYLLKRMVTLLDHRSYQFVHIFLMSWRTLNPESASAVETAYLLDRGRLGDLYVSNWSVLLLQFICPVSAADGIKENINKL